MLHYCTVLEGGGGALHKASPKIIQDVGSIIARSTFGNGVYGRVYLHVSRPHSQVNFWKKGEVYGCVILKPGYTTAYAHAPQLFDYRCREREGGREKQYVIQITICPDEDGTIHGISNC